MQCRKHGGGFPCKECNKEEYKRCVIQNDEGRKPPHDLTELKKVLDIA